MDVATEGKLPRQVPLSLGCSYSSTGAWKKAEEGAHLVEWVDRANAAHVVVSKLAVKPATQRSAVLQTLSYLMDGSMA